jgi:hypothetical protein
MWWGSGTVLKRYLREMQHLGFMVYNDIESCIPWCRHAKECIGEQMYRKLRERKNIPPQKQGETYPFLDRQHSFNRTAGTISDLFRYCYTGLE